MKHLNLKTTKYLKLEESFREWLKTLGYAKSSINGMPTTVREFFHYLEEKGVTDIKKVNKTHGKEFITYFKNRKNTRREGGLSIAHINKAIDTLNKFSRYLTATSQAELGFKLDLLKEENIKPRVVLSIEEIRALYEVLEETHLGIRDRAMLAVYYGCGLRKGEGINLDIGDILFERKLLYIRKTKNNYERYVPVTALNLKALEEYISYARPLLLADDSKECALFISERGKRIHGEMMYLRLKRLVRKAGITKEMGLHSLRHSIATHLLQAGMELENIALFLGHRTLDSTQHYTHLVNEL